MDISGLTNGLMSVTGQTEKAKILIADRRVNADKYLVPEKPTSAGSAAALGGASIPSGASKAMNKAVNAGSAVMGALSGGAEGMLHGASVISDGEFNKSFTVQFNPSSLNLSGFSGGSYDVVDHRGTGKSAKNTPLDPNIALNVTLIFDQMSLANSFPMDSVGFSISQAAKTALGAVSAAMDTMSISVQAATEGIIGVMTNPYTRLICFKWGNLRYKGVLKSVSAQYKMFDIYGRPVRSEVALSLYLADSDIKAEKGTSNLGMWSTAYDACFGDTTKFGAVIADRAKKIMNFVNG